MSFVQIIPEKFSTAAHNLQSVGTAMNAHNATAVAPTTRAIPAAADEVSALTPAGSYRATEAATAATAG